MNNNDTISTLFRTLAVAAVALALVGCPTDSPTAPRQQPVAPTGPSGAWIITISASPASIETGGGSTTITVSIRRAGNGEIPPDGATASILTTLGDLQSADSGLQSGFLTLIGGIAQVALFGGNSTGTAIVEVQLEESAARISIEIRQAPVPGVEPDPAIFSVTPSFGSNDGGDTITINGEGFAQSVQVFFGSGAVSSFDGIEGDVVSASSATVVVVTPAATDFGRDLRNQLVDVLVRNVGGKGDILTSGFRFGFEVKITAVEPLAGPYFGGDVVKIHGEGFDRQPLTIEYGGEVQEDIVDGWPTNFRIRTISEPILTSSCADQSGPTIVTIIENGDQATGASYTYEVVDWAPRINDVRPTELRQKGRQVTILGENFNPGPDTGSFSVSSVTIGGRGVNVDSFTNGRLVMQSPNFGNSFFDTESCIVGTEDGEKYVATSATVIVTNDDTTCQDSFTGSVLIKPSDGSCRAGS